MGEVTSIGTLLINDVLPEDMRRQAHRLDKKGVHQLLMEVAERYPDKYKEVLHGLSEIGRTTVWTEGVSVSLAALRKSKAKEQLLAPVRLQLQQIIDDDSLDDETRKAKIVETLIPLSKPLQDAIAEESRREGSPFSLQIDSGARGNPSSLASLRGADLLATDQNDKFIPIPLLHSYAEGFTPAEYFAAGYGQRKGQLDVKLAVADAGFLSKQLVNATHRQVVTHAEPVATRLPTGLPVDVKDKDNIGAVLALDVGKYKAGTIITDEILQDLGDETDEILIYSPMTDISEDGGISAKAAGRRTRQGLHAIGDNIGIPAAQAIGERLSQGTLSSKHSAGIGTKVKKSGFEYLNRLLQAPEHFPEAGPLSEADGTVNEVVEAAQGGHYIKVGDQQYYAGPDLNVTVKVGDQVEAGDDLTDGVPHPHQLVRLRGMGEARRVYMQTLREALKDSGIKTHRRNIESVVSGVLNWAKVTNPDGIGDNIYDDVVPFNRLSASYTPRPTSKQLPVKQLRGKYLEEPVLHYTPGTRVSSKMIDQLKKYNIESVFANDEEPDFEPHMVRSMLSVYHDPDWRTQQMGFYTARAFQKSLHRGATSDTASTSFVPALSEGKGFGSTLPRSGQYGARPNR